MKLDIIKYKYIMNGKPKLGDLNGKDEEKKKRYSTLSIETKCFDVGFQNIKKTDEKCCTHICKAFPLIFKNLRLKMQDHLLLGGEHRQKISPGFNTPQSTISNLSSEDKRDIVLSDPKFGMFSLFKYHLKRGYLNNELKKTNKIFCSHIFSLLFALPVLVFLAQWFLYIALMSHEIKSFDKNYCPNESSIEHKLMICGISIVYFVRAFFMYDNLTNSIGLNKMNRVNSFTVILDTFQEFLFNILVYGANIWIVFVEDDIQDMIMNSLAMEFLMTLDNEFEELYFKYLPGSADDIYDNIFVSYADNKELVKKRKKEDKCFYFFSCLLFIPYKLLVLTLFLFPIFCLFMAFAGPICK